ncbi:dolichyl-P-Glc:Glc1Man(9)GlcNAc(2)-PP-dolichol alpha-1,3-glucosyltransferase [Martiniozyma asiatica (nom. inval.)]|nr:dolichyl-P-Glc:Glc1Man(9)GlcNAc(2)-PP-dolichol alpha-1,3-glucosyltransferase [Martiniozyma asiatica]
MAESLWNICVGSTLLKLLLVPGYHSTDFDVHRNWLSITALLPLHEWYCEETNQWTLDYPPFFAYFEWVLAKFVPDIVARDGCIALVAKGEYGFPTILFQRATVIVSEFALFASLQWFINTSADGGERKRNFVIAASLVMSPGLFILDHIHFQYNGFLFSILVLSIVSAKLGRYLACAFWFSVLLCFKHIFLYIAPAYFVFLLSGYCLNEMNRKSFSTFKGVISIVKWKNLLKLSVTVLSVFTFAFGPFIYYDLMPQLLKRLFPFSRGLTHAYWAPNFWAIYSFTDRVLILISKKVPNVLNGGDASGLNASLTRGIVGDVSFSFLPQITPKITFLLTLFYQLLSLALLFMQPTYQRFLGSITLCAWSSFIFGWHVHEKAVMLIIVPISFIICQDRRLLPPFQLLTSAGYVSLFPLLFGSAEWLFKALITFVWFVVFQTSLSEVVRPSRKIERRVVVWDRVNLWYLVMLAPMCLILQFSEIFGIGSGRFEFARLIIYSIVCSFGVLSSWGSFSWLYFLDESIWLEAPAG